MANRKPSHEVVAEKIKGTMRLVPSGQSFPIHESTRLRLLFEMLGECDIPIAVGHKLAEDLAWLPAKFLSVYEYQLAGAATQVLEDLKGREDSKPGQLVTGIPHLWFD